MTECKIIKWKCQSIYQDEIYGKGNRLWNPAGKGSDQGSKYRCTVCGNTTGFNATKKK